VSGAHAARRSTSSTAYFQLVIDGARCDGHGICALRCPERITLDEWGYATLDPEPIVQPRVVRRARRAVRACPADALELVGHGDASAERDGTGRVVV
jgi:ferredoxin